MGCSEDLSRWLPTALCKSELFLLYVKAVVTSLIGGGTGCFSLSLPQSQRDVVKLIFKEWFLPDVFPEQNLFVLFASKQMRKIQLAHTDHSIH